MWIQNLGCTKKRGSVPTQSRNQVRSKQPWYKYSSYGPRRIKILFFQIYVFIWSSTFWYYMNCWEFQISGYFFFASKFNSLFMTCFSHTLFDCKRYLCVWQIDSGRYSSLQIPRSTIINFSIRWSPAFIQCFHQTTHNTSTTVTSVLLRRYYIYIFLKSFNQFVCNFLKSRNKKRIFFCSMKFFKEWG